MTAKEQFNYLDNKMRELNLDHAQWRILGYLKHFNTINQSELAKLLGMGKASLGQLIRKFEAEGWINREPSETDKRSYNLQLSGKSKNIARIINKLMHLESERITRDFTTVEKENLKNHLYRIRNNIDQIPVSSNIENLRQELHTEISNLN